MEKILIVIADDEPTIMDIGIESVNKAHVVLWTGIAGPWYGEYKVIKNKLNGIGPGAIISHEELEDLICDS